MSVKEVVNLISDYHNFDDAILESFSYVFLRDSTMDVVLQLYARNHVLHGNIWRVVKITIKGVEEVRSSFTTGQTNVICSGVKLLEFEGKICLDIDGEYGQFDTISMGEIRKYSPCFVIGEEIEAFEMV